MAVDGFEFPEMHTVAGFKMGCAFADVKGRKPAVIEKDDLVLMTFPEESTVAGVFTKNAFCAAPVIVCKENLSENIRALVINSGNANACTGDRGLTDARAIDQKVAEVLSIQEKQVLPFSTGVVGEHLPVERITSTIQAAADDLKEANWTRAARGIMTTDTRPKGASVTIDVGGETITITGISKGSGMIKPNMATMLAYVATDAKVEKQLLQQLLVDAVDQSFNRITVDGDTSTNDSCILVATSQSDAPEIKTENSEAYSAFVEALNSVMLMLAQAIVADGEGATKLVAVKVEHAESNKEALRVAYSIAHSPLVKTALFASDPNWGRIVVAIGYAGVQGLDVSKIDVRIGSVLIVEAGQRAPSYSEALGQSVFSQDRIDITVDLKRGDSNETVWTSDLSYDYVKINAEYRS
ncbi:bifunctional glutamate N-acetyltransferase/amino-acid acetyltransferase ArgJ [Sessilibacter sp. MAH1]